MKIKIMIQIKQDKQMIIIQKDKIANNTKEDSKKKII